MERLQKILARGGIASRRAAEALITAGRVRINGRVATELGIKADPRRDRIEVDGKRVVAEAPVYLVLHKPRGVVATMSDPEGRPTVRELLSAITARVYPVGRLDFATSGLLLITNDGAFADGLLHPRRDVPKTYVVKVKGVMSPDDLDRWRQGVQLDDGMTLPAQAKLLRYEGDKTWFELTIREGRNQQIRRMGDATGFPVMRLSRVAFANVVLEGLKPGQFRPLTREELVALKKAYGVPKSISAQAAPPAAPGRRSLPAPRRGAAARTARAMGKQVEAGREDRVASSERARHFPRPEAREGASPGRGARGRTPGAETGARRSAPEVSRGPRYGGGAPGRRGYDVTEDWGGGAGRGSSRRDRDSANVRDEARPYPDLGGGRGGRTRTTGTSGGIGGPEGGGRVKGRRG